MIRVDFISDVSCPWCAIGANAFVRALERIGDDMEVDLHFRPFELNPQMPTEGEDLNQYLIRHLGMPEEQFEAAYMLLQDRGAVVGFKFGHPSRMWNTFTAHRLLYWAGRRGPAGSQRRLMLSLFQAYHGENRNPSDHDVLLELAAKAGLDVDRARDVLISHAFATEVRTEEQQWRRIGVHSVPTVVIEGEVISGSRSIDQYEEMLRLVNTAKAW